MRLSVRSQEYFPSGPYKRDTLEREIEFRGVETGTRVFETYRQYGRTWQKILDPCALRVLEGAKARCAKVGIDDLIDSQYPGLGPVGGCVGLQVGALSGLRRDIGYYAGSPGFWGYPEGEIGVKGPASEKYQQLVADARLVRHHPFGSKAEEEIAEAHATVMTGRTAKGKRETKGNIALTAVFADIVLKPFLAYPKEVRTFLDRQVGAAVEAAVAEWDACARREWERLTA